MLSTPDFLFKTSTITGKVESQTRSRDMPASGFFDLDRPSAGLGDDRALQLALELSMLGLSDPLVNISEPGDSPADLTSFVNPLTSVGMEDVSRSKKSQNMTECVPVPSSEHVAEIVGRQGKKYFIIHQSSFFVFMLTFIQFSFCACQKSNANLEINRQDIYLRLVLK